jgi:hypothetical protein
MFWKLHNIIFDAPVSIQAGCEFYKKKKEKPVMSAICI